MLGFNTIYAYSYISKKYAHSSKAGLLITSVNEDSLAEKCGLMKGDVIFQTDEWVWTDDPEMIEKAKARIFDGGTVTFYVIRNGEEKELQFTR